MDKPPMNQKDDERVRTHYLLEKSLAQRILASSREERTQTVIESYNTLFSEIPWHSQFQEVNEKKKIAEKRMHFERLINQNVVDTLDIGAFEFENPSDVYYRENRGIIKNHSLFQNYPNPFNPTTAIAYKLSAMNHVTLKIYDILGKGVKTLVNNEQQAGFYDVVWDGTDDQGNKLNSGIYLYRLSAGDFVETCKAIMLK